MGGEDEHLVVYYFRFRFYFTYLVSLEHFKTWKLLNGPTLENTEPEMPLMNLDNRISVSF